MYFRRLAVIVVVAAGTVALAASISKYRPHLGRTTPPPDPDGQTFVQTLPNGQRQLIRPEVVGRILRNLRLEPVVKMDAETLINTLSRKAFAAAPSTLSLIKPHEGKSVLVAYGVAIPGSKDQRILVYLSEDGTLFYLVDDFIRPATERVDSVRLENSQLIFSLGPKDLYAHQLETQQQQPEAPATPSR